MIAVRKLALTLNMISKKIHVQAKENNEIMNNTEKYWYALMPGTVSELMFKIMHYK